VINTITGGRIPLRDGFQIRRMAAEKRIPCFTSLDTARAAVQAVLVGAHNYNIQPVSDYRNKDNPRVEE
jgi:carbamoyl-phosphate synthase large subunit